MTADSIEKKTDEVNIANDVPLAEVSSNYTLPVEKTVPRFIGAVEYIAQHGSQYSAYSAKEANMVLRKIDWRLLPLMWITTNISAIDKIVISNANLYGMSTDTHLVGQQYSWVGSIFYFGFLFGEFPFGPLIQKLPIGKLLAGTVLMWGILVTLMGAAQNAAGLMTLRFLMGAFEAPIYPILSIITILWYKKSEQALRVTVWFTGISSVFTGLVSWGIGHTHTTIASWRLLFIVLGGFTILWAGVLFMFLPDGPLNGNFLNEKEKFIAVDRIKENMTGDSNREFKWYQFREAFMDWKSWCIVAISILLNIPNGGLVTFAAQIVSGMGYGKLQTTLLGMPTGVIQTASAFMVSGLSHYTTNMRTVWGSMCCLVPLACSILIRKLSTSNKIGRLISYYFFYFFWGAYPTIISLPLANTSGHTKKITVNAMVFSSYCIANIIAPQLFQSKQAPEYTTGYNGITGFEIGAITCMAIYAVGVRLENRRRDRKQEGVPELTTEIMLDDLTDWEKPAFRYVC